MLLTVLPDVFFGTNSHKDALHLFVRILQTNQFHLVGKIIHVIRFGRAFDFKDEQFPILYDKIHFFSFAGFKHQTLRIEEFLA